MGNEPIGPWLLDQNDQILMLGIPKKSGYIKGLMVHSSQC